MTEIVKWVYLVALGVWAGSMVFFSFGVAPVVFKVLKPEDAARLQRAVFPRYYTTGIVCAALGLICDGILLADQVFAVWPGVLSLLLLAGTGCAVFWLRQDVMPRMNKTDRGDGEWKQMHRLSVQLNAAVLLVVLTLMLLAVFGHVI